MNPRFPPSSCHPIMSLSSCYNFFFFFQVILVSSSLRFILKCFSTLKMSTAGKNIPLIISTNCSRNCERSPSVFIWESGTVKSIPFVYIYYSRDVNWDFMNSFWTFAFLETLMMIGCIEHNLIFTTFLNNLYDHKMFY